MTKPPPPMRGTKGFRRWLRKLRNWCGCWWCCPRDRVRKFHSRRDRAYLKQDKEQT